MPSKKRKVEKREVLILIEESLHFQQKEVVAVFQSEQDLNYFLSENPQYAKPVGDYKFKVEKHTMMIGQ